MIADITTAGGDVLVALQCPGCEEELHHCLWVVRFLCQSLSSHYNLPSSSTTKRVWWWCDHENGHLYLLLSKQL